MSFKYFFFVFVIFSCFSCKEESTDIITAEMIYSDLIGDWEVDYQFEHIVDGIVDPD